MPAVTVMGAISRRQALRPGRRRLLLAGGTVLVHGVAADAVALGHHLGDVCMDQLQLGLSDRVVHQHVLVHLHARRRCSTPPTRTPRALARDDALGGGGDGLQAR